MRLRFSKALKRKKPGEQPDASSLFERVKRRCSNYWKPGFVRFFEYIEIGNIARAEQLLDGGVNINSESRNGYTALHFAVREHQVKSVEFLLAKDIEVNSIPVDGSTPLLWAAEEIINNDEDSGLCVNIFYLLLNAGADPNLKNDQDEVPVQVIVDNGKLDVLLQGKPDGFDLDLSQIKISSGNFKRCESYLKDIPELKQPQVIDSCCQVGECQA
jgi:hypothetical protein